MSADTVVNGDSSIAAPGSDLVLSCAFNMKPEVCSWHHNNVNKDNDDNDDNGKFDVLCTEAARKNHVTKTTERCKDHDRIAFLHHGLNGHGGKLSKKKKDLASIADKICAIRIKESNAEDAGAWRLEALALTAGRKMVRNTYEVN